ncbi:PIN domain-containing protein [Cupriavidus metallidurans]|uniref:PIN domain-containing protein n=1 Tax=Cupriavidus metallidurans TaxID=119219 RepID=UPI000569A824|nr:PIN domain-containing protein [Cupriavidus metallidurans]
MGGPVVLVDFESVQAIDFGRLASDTRIAVFAGELQRKVPIEVAMGLQEMGGRARWVRSSGTGPNALDFHIAFELGRMAQAGEHGPVVVLSRDKGFDPLLDWLRTQHGIAASRVTTIAEAFGYTPDALNAPPAAEPIVVEFGAVTPAPRPAQPALQSKGMHVAESHFIPHAVPAPASKAPAKPDGAKAAKPAGGATRECTAEKAREILARSRKAARPRRRATLAKHIHSMFRPATLADREVESIIKALLAKKWISESQGAITYNF